MIEFKHVSKVFHGQTIIDDISFVIEDGEFVVLLGESGCGKTTTLKMINKLIEPSSGTVEINGRDISGTDPIALRRRMGYVIQQIGLFPHMTVRENIEIIAKMNNRDKGRLEQNARRLMEMVNLDPDQFLDAYPSEMSGGQQQRAGVVRAFMTEPEIILMDEPFSALDPITRTQIQNALIDMQTALKRTIVFVTHDMDEAIRLADRICIMDKGKIVQFDTPENILKYPANEFVRNFIGPKRIWTSPEYIRTRDIMISDPVCCHPKLPAFKCIELMGRKRVDTLMVTDQYKRIYGVLFAESLIGIQDLKKPAEELMERQFTSVPPDSSIVDLLTLFDEKHLSTLPVVDSQGIIEGLITRSTLVNTLSRQFIQEKKGA
ncbi:MAG TPA: ABC transporter ATP-binding protein [Candidatus Lachnoclostridium pullistercoris]|uniref:Quaternary amine transport ATP-binding protein n=1 Tax=Candidatus Lachnoclostridium pullistercoris TaxID=2838632 RepID=A0A9D2T7S0_9FIRM|nr:ABC transporter ATP-binding protein [Candidatus Lachnoclostridium pullistercoris]